MNRLAYLSASQHTVAAATRRERALLRNKPRRELPQCVLVPQHYEQNYAYQFRVWLHTAGGAERRGVAGPGSGTGARGLTSSCSPTSWIGGEPTISA